MTVLRVRHVADVNPPCAAWDRLPDDAEVTFVPLEAVWPRSVDVSRMRPKAETATGYTRFQQGDVIVPKITPTFEADRSTWVQHVPTFVATGTTELHVVRAHVGTDPRYLDYLFSSAPFLAGGAAEMIGVAGQKRVPDSWLRDFPVRVADDAEQRAIADYLDTETARIDALIAKKQQLIHLLNERMDALVDLHFSPADSGPTVRLARLAYVQSGVTLNAAKALVGETVRLPYLRVANVQPGWLDLSEVKEVDVDAAKAARSELRVGDVLMTEGGDIDKLGRGTVWRGEIGRCLHQNHVFAVRPNPTLLDSDYLANVTRTSYARAYFESTGVQSTNLASTNASKVADFRLPTLPVGVQREKCTAFERAAGPLLRAEAKLRAQTLLLAEHRQALTTAAVTAQHSVPANS